MKSPSASQGYITKQTETNLACGYKLNIPAEPQMRHTTVETILFQLYRYISARLSYLLHFCNSEQISLKYVKNKEMVKGELRKAANSGDSFLCSNAFSLMQVLPGIKPHSMHYRSLNKPEFDPLQFQLIHD